MLIGQKELVLLMDMRHNEDRELDIRLAELQADIQINLTICFGILAVFITAMVGLEQIYFSLPSENSVAKIGSLISLIVLGIIVLLFIKPYLKKVEKARKEMEELRKQYIW